MHISRDLQEFETWVQLFQFLRNMKIGKNKIKIMKENKSEKNLKKRKLKREERKEKTRTFTKPEQGVTEHAYLGRPIDRHSDLRVE